MSNPIREISTPDIMSMLETMRTDYVRMQSQFATVIQEMEEDLKRMRDNERIPQDIINKRDLQIDTLIKFNNKIEDLLTTYKLTTLNLQAQLMHTNEMLWNALKSDKTAFEVLMHRLVPLKKG